jgi:hypothetical protein
MTGKEVGEYWWALRLSEAVEARTERAQKDTWRNMRSHLLFRIEV